MDAPTTAARFMTLPVCDGFSAEDRLIDGRRVRVPVAPDLVAFTADDDTVMMCVDADGQGWRLARYADGTWTRILIVA